MIVSGRALPDMRTLPAELAPQPMSTRKGGSAWSAVVVVVPNNKQVVLSSVERCVTEIGKPYFMAVFVCDLSLFSEGENAEEPPNLDC